MAEPSRGDEENRFLAVVKRYGQYFLAAVTIILAIILSIVGLILLPNPANLSTWLPGILFGLATSLFAAVVFALLYSWVVERYFIAAISTQVSATFQETLEAFRSTEERRFVDLVKAYKEELQLIVDNNENRIQSLLESHYGQITASLSEFIPTRYFKATDVKEAGYQNYVRSVLMKSQRYLYKSVAARYVPRRIDEMMQRNKNATFQVLMVDPRQSSLLWIYAHDRASTAETEKQNIEERVVDVQRGIYMTVVELFDLVRTHPHSIEVGVYNGSISYRTEIFDDEVFVSFYVETKQYPTTYVYNRDTIFYRALNMDFDQSFRNSINIRLSNRTTSEQVTNFLTKIDCEESIEDLRKAYIEFYKEQAKKR